jgi:amino acid adenylation domain-containing protein
MTTPEHHAPAFPAVPLPEPKTGAAISAAERHQLLVEWNQTHVAFPYPADVGLHDLIDEQARRNPDAVALIFDAQRITFRELMDRVHRLGRRLQKLGVEPDSIVAICMERSLEMVVAIVATLKAGGAYLPLDPENPADRLKSILDDAHPAVLLTQERLKEKLPRWKGRVLALDAESASLASESAEFFSVKVRPENLAYVIFTSGSTGKPKGALIPHRAIVNHMLWMRSHFAVGTSARVLQRTPYTFDASVWEIFLPLVTGAALVIARPNGHKDVSHQIETIQQEQVTVVQFVPSMLRVLLEAEDIGKCRTLRFVFCGGEALTKDLQKLFFERAPAELYNLYGPTECTIDATMWKCLPDWSLPNIPIGRPIANLTAYILDENQNLLPPGSTGELYIGGVGVGRGYLNRPELTAERFLRDPFSAEPGARMYKTGDLARFLGSGDIEYRGRIDFQVKIRGLRIELGEIENVILDFPGVHQAVVVAREDAPGEKRLAAYLVPKDTDNFRTRELRDFLKSKLPDYMVPAAIVSLPVLPLTSVGKVDRRALPAPSYDNLAGAREYTPPRTQTERQMSQIWSKFLGVEKVGTRENFFDLGGDSLLALMMFAQISKEFGNTLSLNSLFDTPTIEQLSLVIDAGRAQGPKYRLVTIRAEGTRPPLFWVPGGIGSVLAFRRVSVLLGQDLPVYGLEFRLPENGETFEEIEVRARHFVEQMRALQPTGPYYIAGFCSGVLVAYEMAQQLSAQGQQVAFLALVEGTPAKIPGALWNGIVYHAQHLAWRVRKVTKGGPTGLFRWLAERARSGVKLLGNRSGASPAPAPVLDSDKVMANLHRLETALNHVETRYNPQPYSGDAVLMVGCDNYSFYGVSESADPRLTWRRLIRGKAQVDILPGDHLYMLLHPHVQPFAARLRQRMDEAWVASQKAQPGLSPKLSDAEGGAQVIAAGSH